MILYQNIALSSNYDNAYFCLMFSFTNNTAIGVGKILNEIQKVIGIKIIYIYLGNKKIFSLK